MIKIVKPRRDTAREEQRRVPPTLDHAEATQPVGNGNYFGSRCVLLLKVPPTRKSKGVVHTCVCVQ